MEMWVRGKIAIMIGFIGSISINCRLMIHCQIIRGDAQMNVYCKFEIMDLVYMNRV